MTLPAAFQNNFEKFCPNAPTLKVLEAGGGSTNHLALPDHAHITTIDISQEQLDRNAYAHEKIHGDLETFDFSNNTFDIIICWDVIEHLKNPKKALDNLAGTLSPNGILVLGAPIVNSAKGIITKFTPHAFHILAHKFLLRSKNAGLPGYAPFPTHMRLFIAPHNLKRHIEKNNQKVVFLKKVQSIHVDYLFKKSKILWSLYKGFSIAAAAMTLGYIKASSTDFMMIVKEPARADATS